MNPAERTAAQLVDCILRLCTRHRQHLDQPTWDVVRETCRRLKQHGTLLHNTEGDAHAEQEHRI